MLRITIHKESEAIRFIVEGRLAGPWVEELKKCWQENMDAKTGPSSLPLLVDLSAMTFMDAAGKALLCEMHRRGVRLAAVGLMSQAIVEEISG